MENPSYKFAWNHSKNAWVVLNAIFFVFKNFSKNFHEYIRMEDSTYKNENIDKKFLINMWKNQFLKINISLLELKKTFCRIQRHRHFLNWL